MSLAWRIPGTHTALPAYIVPPQATRSARAWLSGYVTIRLTEGAEAVRSHVAAQDIPQDVPFAENAGPAGYWYVIGAFVQTWAQILSQQVEQNPLSESGLIYLHPGTTLNVGIGTTAFGRSAGSGQAEFVSGPAPRIETLDMYLERVAGSADSWIPLL